MNEESLSALLDGECGPAELSRLLQEMERDPVLRERFSRMRLAQEARRGTPIRSAQLDFASGVLAALPARPDAGAIPLRGARPVRWQPLAGLAAAAAVGAIAVLALRPEGGPVPAGPVPVAAVAPSEPPAATAGAEDEQARQLRNYLIAYSQSRAQHGVGGTLGYARYAAYSGDRAPGAEP